MVMLSVIILVIGIIAAISLAIQDHKAMSKEAGAAGIDELIK